MRIDVMILGECIEGDEKAAWDRSLGKFSFSGRIEEDNLSKEDEGCPDSVTVLSWRLVEKCFQQDRLDTHLRGQDQG